MRSTTTARSVAVSTLQYLGLWLVSWGAGLLTYIGSLALVARQSLSRGDLYPVVATSLVAYGLALLVVYLPILRMLRGFLRGVDPAWPFAAIAVLLGVLPTAMIGLFWGGGARVLLHVEAFYFLAFFAGTGIVLGMGYVRLHRIVAQPGAETDRPARSDAFRRRLSDWSVREHVSRPDHIAAGNRIRGTQMEFPASPFLRIGLSLLELPIAIGVAYAVFLGVYLLGCRIHPCYDLQSLGPLMVALPTGVVLGIAFWIVALRMGKRLRRRLIWDGAAALLGIAAYVVPQVMAHLAAAERTAQIAAGDREFAQRRAAWIEALRQDAHAPPGETPPMLNVVDEGAAAIVTNTAPKGRTIALGRVTRDATAPGGWRGCAMYTDGRNSYYFLWLGPGETMRYVLDPRCAESFIGAAIEYRVGNDPSEQGWWSDSAFAAPEGRKNTPGR